MPHPDDQPQDSREEYLGLTGYIEALKARAHDDTITYKEIRFLRENDFPVRMRKQERRRRLLKLLGKPVGN